MCLTHPGQSDLPRETVYPTKIIISSCYCSPNPPYRCNNNSGMDQIRPPPHNLAISPYRPGVGPTTSPHFSPFLATSRHQAGPRPLAAAVRSWYRGTPSLGGGRCRGGGGVLGVKMVILNHLSNLFCFVKM